jgi:phage baseplate assembly protein W
MSGTRYGSWKFNIPHPEDGEMRRAAKGDEGSEPGLSLSSGGGIEMVTEEESVRQSILLLLATRPGERVMRADYGCNLHRLLFSPNDDTTAGLARHYVQRAIERWEPRIRILNLDASRSEPDPDRLNIQLEYRLRSTQRIQQLMLPVSLSGEDR